MAAKRPSRERESSVKPDASPESLGGFALDTVHGVDCLEALRCLPEACIDVAIADPPYNVSKGGQWSWDDSTPLPGFGGPWAKVMAAWDNLPLNDYLRFTLAWLSELRRVVRPTGSLWIHGTYHNIGVVNFALQLLDVEIINEVIWYKRNSFPNLSGRRLTASHETILWAHTGEPQRRRYHFDYAASKQMFAADDALKQPGKQLRTVWDIPNNKSKEELAAGKHPTQKPLRLLTRMLQLSARPGDVILSPFAGSGSDCVAARQLGMRFLGFERDATYVGLCHRRLGAHAASGSLHRVRRPTSIPSLIKWTGSKRSQAPRIAAQMPPYRRYFEPFLGGGALLFAAAVPGSVAGDRYEPLVRLWQLMQSEPRRVIDDYAANWSRLQQELASLDRAALRSNQGVPQLYYEIRDRFNQSQSPLDLNFLLRTCVNGIVRFNRAGQFNNSFHLSRPGMEPERFAAAVDQWHQVIQGVRFVCQDFAETVAEADRDDFVYFDPPYVGNRQRYSASLDVDKLLTVLESLNRRGVRWALSLDGRRGDVDYAFALPKELYQQRLSLTSGNSAVHRVLNGPVEQVEESLYLNY